MEFHLFRGRRGRRVAFVGVLAVVLAPMCVGTGLSARAQGTRPGRQSPPQGTRTERQTPLQSGGQARTAVRDRRVRPVQNTTLYPYSAICKVIATFPDETTVEGTGTMIGPHHCLTALHLLYDARTKISAKRVRIVPGYDDERLLTKGLSSHPFGTTRMTQFLFWEPHDIAILVTAENIGNHSSWMTVGSRSDRELLSPSLMLAGYTSEPSGSERQSTLSALITRVEGDRVTMNTDNIQALDGGPIFERQSVGRSGEQDVWTIVGIQTAANRGTRIPAEMRRILDRFLHDDFSGVNAKIPIPEK